jgi:epoxyqueuosine reductase
VSTYFPLPTSVSKSIAIKNIGHQLGFQQVGITDARLDPQHQHYARWIERNYHGEMSYMARNVSKRLHPDELVPDTLSVI